MKEGIPLVGPESDEDTHADFTVYELKAQIEKGPDTLETFFDTHVADEVETHMAVEYYENIIAHPEALIGNGTNALVYKQHANEAVSRACVKCRWGMLMLNNKSKRPDRLPPHLRPLKDVERYFDDIKRDTAARRQRGIEAIVDNKALHEAALQKLAQKVLHEAGSPGRIPEVDFVVEINREESGEYDNDPYSISETAYLIHMEQVQGVTIEEFVRNRMSTNSFQEFDIDGFESELRAMLTVLHDAGIAHRDLTLRNIMIDEHTHLPWIIDFGKSVYAPSLRSEDRELDMSFIDRSIGWLKESLANPEDTAQKLDRQQDSAKLTSRK